MGLGFRVKARTRAATPTAATRGKTMSNNTGCRDNDTSPFNTALPDKLQ